MVSDSKDTKAVTTADSHNVFSRLINNQVSIRLVDQTGPIKGFTV